MNADPAIIAAMPKATVTFNTVRKIAREFPGVEEGTAWGSPALKVRGKYLAGIPTNRAAERGSIVVAVDFADRAGLLAEAPDIYYLPEHYKNYPSVLVRLARVTPDVLRDLLGMAYKFATAKAKPPKKKR